MTDSGIKCLLLAIDQGYNKKAWHGSNLRGSIRGVSLKTATFRPAPGRHNIWEHVVHAGYWKYVVRRRLLGEKRGSFPLKGSNWFVRDSPLDAAVWEADIALLEQTHRSLRAAVATLADVDLDKKPPGSKVANADIVFGIAAHDIYHAGQIQLLKRLAD